MSNGINVLSTAWNLRTHPFSPTLDQKGNSLAFDASRALDPLHVDNLMHLYFDVYKWEESPDVCQLSAKDGLEKFPNLDMLVENDETLVVIVSGKDFTGVRSLVNLIQYKAKQNSSKLPLFFTGRLGPQKKDGWTKTIVKFFIDEYCSDETRPTYAELKKIYEEESAELKDNPDGYLNLPQRIHRAVHKICFRPMIFTLDLNDKFIYENWTSIYEIVNRLVHLLIIPTRKSIDASTFYASKRTEIKVVHIEACNLDRTKAHSYLSQRLRLYRINNLSAGLPDITPFSESALNLIFERGSNTTDSSPITFPIGWLNKRFRTAVDKQAEYLANSAQASGVLDFAHFTPPQILIQEQMMETVINELNKTTY